MTIINETLEFFKQHQETLTLLCVSAGSFLYLIDKAYTEITEDLKRRKAIKEEETN